MSENAIPEGVNGCSSSSLLPSPPRQSGSRAADLVLTPTQLHALFDILTHYETYEEVSRFKLPGTISSYGYPFVTKTPGGQLSHSSVPSAPLLASLFRPLVLPIPGVRDLPADFWGVHFQGVMTKLSAAGLSESYDKGALGTRKTLATASSVVHEAVTRGYLGGVPRGEPRDLDGAYDRTKAADVVRAWDDAVHELVHGSLVDELFDYVAEKENLEEHSNAVGLAVDYIIIHLATFMHHILTLSPEGPYLLKLAENVHKMIPYSVVKQTVRISNAATMMNTIVKLFLAKMSVGAVSNWLGLTQHAADGMNLLQRIISLVLAWDSSEFRKSAEKIEKAKGGPSKEHLAAIRDFVGKHREEHDAARHQSMEQKISIVAAILEPTAHDSASRLSEEQHTQCLEYYSALLSVRDRDEIVRSLCYQNPDHFTQAVRDAASSFEPMIRTIHARVDLREHIAAMESFLNDLISTSKARKAASSNHIHTSHLRKRGATEASVPLVEDYVSLLRRNRQLLYAWLHQVASKCPETSDEFRTWVKSSLKMFQSSPPPPSPSTTSTAESRATPADLEHAKKHAKKHPGSGPGPDAAKQTRRVGAAGAMSEKLQDLFAALPPETQQTVLGALDAHATYVDALEDLSMVRMQQVLDNRTAQDTAHPKAPGGSHHGGSLSGPGMYLYRWQALLDSTCITPGPAGGAFRQGKDVKGTLAQGKTGAVSSKDGWDFAALAELGTKDVPQAPNVDVVVAALRPGFEGLLAEMTSA